MKDGNSDAYMPLVRECYDYVYLHARQQAGVRLDPGESSRLERLRGQLEGDSARRRHVRRPALVPVLVKVAGRTRRGTMLNLSGGGMLVATPEHLPLGSTVRVTFGAAGQLAYIFPCEVVRRDHAGSGLSFRGVPLEIRYGSYSQTLERDVA